MIGTTRAYCLRNTHSACAFAAQLNNNPRIAQKNWDVICEMSQKQNGKTRQPECIDLLIERFGTYKIVSHCVFLRSRRRRVRNSNKARLGIGMRHRHLARSPRWRRSCTQKQNAMLCYSNFFQIVPLVWDISLYHPSLRLQVPRTRIVSELAISQR